MTNKFVMTNISPGSENLNRWYDFKAVAHAGGWGGAGGGLTPKPNT